MDVAQMIARKVGAEIETIPFPNHLKDHYQEFTQANTEKLTTIGNPIRMRRVQDYISNSM